MRDANIPIQNLVLIRAAWIGALENCSRAVQNYPQKSRANILSICNKTLTVQDNEKTRRDNVIRT